MILRIFFTLLSLVFLVTVTPVYAQSVTIDNTEYKKKVLKYLASDYFITEGLGLQKAYIGQTLEQLTAAMGKPQKKKKQGMFSGLVIYSYQLDKQSALQVGIKRGIVKAIALAGAVSSQYTTVKGARFGMPVHEIINYYGAKKLRDNKLLYSSQGIRFDFKNNTLRVIRIFPKR